MGVAWRAEVYNFYTAGICGTRTRSRECVGSDDGCIRCDGCFGTRIIYLTVSFTGYNYRGCCMRPAVDTARVRWM